MLETLENRNFANLEVDKNKRYQQIIECLGTNEMTAKEIANEMYMRGMIPTNERNFTSPRITEMLQDGILEIAGKKKCEWTGKSVTMFRRR
jgi:hypothetical protein